MPVALAVRANEESTYAITIAITDEAGDATAPATATWTLTTASGAVINTRTNIAITPLASTMTVVLKGDDLALQTGETGPALRCFCLKATYNSDLGAGLPLNAEARFYIDPIVAVT